MIYEYSELKGIIKVGDTVRAVPGKVNECHELQDDGSNTQLITHVDDTYFMINGCRHKFKHANCYLEIVEPTDQLDGLQEYTEEEKNMAQQCYIQCIAAESGEGECAQAIAETFPFIFRMK